MPSGGRDMGMVDVMGGGALRALQEAGEHLRPIKDRCEIFMDNFLTREFYAAATAGMSGLSPMSLCGALGSIAAADFGSAPMTSGLRHQHLGKCAAQS